MFLCSGIKQLAWDETFPKPVESPGKILLNSNTPLVSTD